MANLPDKPTIYTIPWINGQTKLNSANLTSGVNNNLTHLKTAIDGIIDNFGEYLPLSGGTVTGPVDFNSSIEVAGNAQFDSSVQIDDDLNVYGDSIFAHNVTITAAVPTEASHATRKDYVDNLVASVKTNAFQVVQSLPQTGEEGIIYLVPKANTDYYTQYIWEGNSWLNIGDTQIDLSGYLPLTGGTINGNLNVNGTTTLSAGGQTSLVVGQNDIVAWKTLTAKSALNVDGLIYAGGHEIRFPTYVEFKDNTDQHNVIMHVNQDYVNFWRQATYLSNIKISAANDANPPIMQTNFDREGGWVVFGRGATFNAAAEYNGLIWVGGREIRFPDYVDFKDNTNAHNTVLKIDQNYINAEKVLTAKQGINIDIQPTEAQNATRKDYVDSMSAKMTEITWAALKALRDGGNLVPGMQYRITDYQCTTSAYNTTSAGHQFDIIVVADDANILNENARACLHEGDTYFANSKLEAWKLWYCLDNDTSRFDWADSTNGKGVIYRMIDDFDNDVPYDFKNILFMKEDEYSFIYTFSYKENSEFKDASLSQLKNCYSNVIKKYFTGTTQALNFIMFCSRTATFNCYANTFRHNCSYNTFGNNCYNNKFDTYCLSNIFDSTCYNNCFGYNCGNNVFGAYCSNNNFGVYCSNNKFGSICHDNTFGANCSYITFGDSSSRISYCQNIIVDNNCSYLYINSSDTDASSSNQLQNIHIHLGVAGSSDANRLTITVPDRALVYETSYEMTGSTTVTL